jgi:GMP synthase (glutamine-hydrolysing)
MIRPVLIVLHQEQSTPGRVGLHFQSRGIVMDIRRPRSGDPLPATLAGHSGAVIFGGPMSVNDGDSFIRDEIDWIAVPLREDKPYLGICLGAQMLARQLGAAVGPHPQGTAEIGYYPIRATPAGREVIETWPEVVYQWHREGFGLPAGAQLLAEGCLQGAGLSLWRGGLRHPVSRRSNTCHDVSLDDSWTRAPGAAGR